MIWLKIIAAIVILSLAQDVSGKSIKKHSSKKQAVPGQKSHYLILMGNPVQDGRQNKGLGMILSSEHGPTSEGERYNPSIENHFRSKANSYGFKSGPDLAATLQQTSRHEPRNGYSYTEALFTGAPLLNGKPSSESDDGESKDEHEGNINNSNNNVQAVLKEDKSIHRLKDKGSWQQEGNGDYGMHKGDDTPKEKQPEDSVQKQIEIHTEEGVEGVALDEGHKNNGKGSEALTSSQSAKQVGTSLESKPDHNLLGKRPENRPDYDPHQYLIAGPSLYESSSESDTGRLGKHLGEYTKNSPEQESQQPSAHEADSHHQGESEETSVDKGRHEPLVQDIHHGLAAENTHDNYEHKPEGSSHPTEEEEKNNKSLSDKMSAQTSHEGSHNEGPNNEGLHNERLHNEGSNNEGSHNEGMHNDPSSAHENLVHKEVGLPIERQPEESAGNAVNTPLDDGVATDLHKEQVSHTTNANLQHQHLASSGMGTDGLSIEEASHQMPTSLSHEEFVHKPELNSLGTSSEEHRINDNSVPAFLQSHESSSNAVNSQPNGKKLIYSDIGPVSGQVLYTTSKLPVQNQNRSTALVASEPNDGILHGDSPGMKHFPHKIITSSSEKEYTQKFISGSSQVMTGVSIKQSTHKITPVSHPGFADNDLGSENSDEERNSRPSDQDNDKLPSQSSFRESNKGLLGSSHNEEPAKDHQEPSPVEESRLDSHAHGLPLEGPRLGSAAYSSKGSDALTIAQQTGSTQPSPEGALHEHNTADEESKLAHSSGVPSGEESIEAQQSSAARFRPDNMMHETQNGEPPKDEGSNTAPTNVLKLKQESADVGDHGPPSYRPHEFQVGKPEMTSKEPGTNSFHPPATKEENQSLKYNDTTDGRMSEGIRHPGRKEEDKNQEIVYYMKMAKGKPLFNGHEPYLDQNPEKSHEQAEHSAETDIEQHPSIDDGKSGELSDRRYRWRWNPRPVSNPSPSPSSFPSPSPSPSPSPFPSPSPSPSPSPNPFGGGGGGAVGGSSVDSSGEQSDSDFEQEALNVHNNYRKTHNVPEMTLDRDLSNQAKAYAQTIANMGQLQHSSDAERGKEIGENLAYACSSNGAPLTGKSATEMWYNEVCKPGYNFNYGGFSGRTGHFTQVVWKDSVALGIGQGKATRNGMPCIYVVGRYKSAGNMNGQFQAKVLRGNFNQQYCNSVKSSYGK